MATTYLHPHRISYGRHLLKSLSPIPRYNVPLHQSSANNDRITRTECARRYSSAFNAKISVSLSINSGHISWKLNANNLDISCWDCQNVRHFSCTSRNRRKDSDEPHNTFDQAEVQKFSRLSNTWWSEQGEFAALHSMNALRVPLFRDALAKAAPGDQPKTLPLRGIKIVDVGCGGGILSEPLARLGAEVLGVDASPENVAAAEAHAACDPRLTGRLSYKTCLVEDLAAGEGPIYDGVVASEIIEHVADASLFVQACCDLLKPGASVFFTTLNRTWVAYALAVVAAERILRIVPAGAHDWNKFVTPDELSSMLKQNGVDVHLVHGMQINPINLRWRWSEDVSMNYAIHGIKR